MLARADEPKGIAVVALWLSLVWMVEMVGRTGDSRGEHIGEISNGDVEEWFFVSGETEVVDVCWLDRENNERMETWVLVDLYFSESPCGCKTKNVCAAWINSDLGQSPCAGR